MDVLAHTSKNTAPNRYPSVFVAIKNALHWEEGQTKKILSIGCGEGDEVWTLRELFPESIIHGYDLDVEAIQKAQETNEEYPQVDFFYRKTDLWNDYDLVMCMSVACRYPNSKEFKYSQFCCLMNDINKCVAPGGFIAIYNAQYDFCSYEELADLYIPIDIGRTDSGTVPKFTPDGDPLGREFWVPILHKKISLVELPILGMESPANIPWQPRVEITEQRVTESNPQEYVSVKTTENEDSTSSVVKLTDNEDSTNTALKITDNEDSTNTALKMTENEDSTSTALKITDNEDSTSTALKITDNEDSTNTALKMTENENLTSALPVQPKKKRTTRRKS